jgi:DNA helicase-4
MKAERRRKDRKEQERVRAEMEAKRIKEKAVLQEMHPNIVEANKLFSKYISLNDGYFNSNKLSAWKSSVSNLHSEVCKHSVETLSLDRSLLEDINQLKTNYKTGETIRKRYNKKFVEKELHECDTLFSNIEGQSLDEQQRLAIIKDEDNNLVIAGAGSGKTTTVAGKVAYLINRFKVKPQEILLITFTKKASDEMKRRIELKMNVDIDVHTFHSFGRKIIGEATNNMPAVIEENQFYTEMRNIFKELFKNPNYASNVIKFITQYRLEAKDVNEFESHGEYISYLKDNNIRPYKPVETVINGRRTMLREICKSLEEVQIANFLFLNGINYSYEEPYKYATANNRYAQYKPDFYLPDYDIYIEHFALIDRDRNVPHWFNGYNYIAAKSKYNQDIAWKRKTHSEHQTLLIETYSYENKEGVLLENLKANLEAQGVLFNERTNEEIWQILNSIANDEVSALDTLINTFLNLFKSNNFQIEKLTKQVEDLPGESAKSRYLIFLKIFFPILSKYNEVLKSRNLIDFSDMINDASKYIAEKKFKNNFKYIIIDEFQDTSIGRFNLIKALLNNNKACKLFAVGDDWQSIYRFAGSDISLFTQFEEHFGVTEISKIETTYRFNKSMIDLSSKFILRNPNQTPKDLRAFTNEPFSPIEIISSDSFRNDDPLPLIEALNHIDKENNPGGKKLKILALARYKHILNLYKQSPDAFEVKYNSIDKTWIIKCFQFQNLEVEFLTVHRSKGLEADYVILLNCVSGQYGFPSEQADDPILNLLLSKSDQFTNGEERRLFYVALTRSKRKTFITTNDTYRSKFIDEIDPHSIEDPRTKCPSCKTGDKIKQEGINRDGEPYIKYTCSNWKYGCEYLVWR